MSNFRVITLILILLSIKLGNGGLPAEVTPITIVRYPEIITEVHPSWNQCKNLDESFFEVSARMEEELKKWIESLPPSKKPLPEPQKCASLSNLTDSLRKQLNLPKANYKIKKEVKIAIIDTGIDFSNPAFRNKIYKPTFMKFPKEFYGFDLIHGDFRPIDRNGHGTHVAGIILGLFPQAKIIPIKFYEGFNNADIGVAILLAIKSGADIINISGGGPSVIYSELEAIQMARAKGILVVASAGNDNINLAEDPYKFYPASYQEDNIISVSAHESNGFKSKYSNYGNSYTHISARGELISFVPKYQNPTCLGKMHGTSQAAPVVTAAAAIIMASNPELSYHQVKNQLLKNSDSAPLNKPELAQGRLNWSRSISGQISDPQVAKNP